ncbi:MAG: hypothetical protein PF447_12565, partial [Spirochaetaceae bacterium]|nr:hypothetical protein [Spirochaetaceae bacterium]
NYIKLDFNMELLEEINDTYIDTRYPSDLGLLPDGSLSSEHAIDFYKMAKEILNQIEIITEKA